MREDGYPAMDVDAKVWARWEEETVSSDRGRREVHYYVLDDCGGRDLAVVGREKSARHMAYAVPVKFLQSLIRMANTASPSSVAAAADVVLTDRKLRSRRHVVDWLSLLVSDSMSHRLPPMLDRCSDDEDASTASLSISKDFFPGKLAHHSEEFLWLGSAWDCKKRRKHYQSFNRKGITISVNDFVYVLTEDNKRLVAYIEDLYEDMMTRNMVTVRWFHKVDEVSIVLPPDTNDREIFFSLCLQDFSVECIDGLASVLGIEDFEKFQKEAPQRYSLWEPYLCRKLIDNDDIKPFDITQVQGYWSQNLLRSMYPSHLKLRLKIKGHGSSSESNKNCFDSQGNVKREPLSNSEGQLDDLGNSKGLRVGNRLENNAGVTDCSTEGLVKNALFLHQASIAPAPGHDIELLSQDSGIRGCWFCCVVLKRHRDKIKVKYLNVQDADGVGNLEEWVSTSRIAAPDKSAIRMLGRPVVRPSPSKKDESLCTYEYGKVVDAWWYDGWWEGIVIGNDSENKIRVCFPGEQRVSVFHPSDLRSSQEWVENRWNHLNKRPDIATLLLSELDSEKCSDCITFQTSPSDTQPELVPNIGKENCLPPFDPAKACRPQFVKDFLSEKEENYGPDLVRKCHRDGLRWYSTRKRTHGRQLFSREIPNAKRLRIKVGQKCSSGSRNSSSAVLIPKSLKVIGDQDNCKTTGDPLFGAPMTLCSNLVMTR